LNSREEPLWFQNLGLETHFPEAPAFRPLP